MKSLALSIILLCITGTLADCDKGWLSKGKKCYKQNLQLVVWEKARASCESHGAQLVKIESKEENDFLAKHFVQKRPGDFFANSWIGLRRMEEDGEFHWSDGSRAKYTNWEAGQPMAYKLYGIQPCGIMGNGVLWIGGPTFKGTWMDIGCDYEVGYVCEKPRD